MRAIAKRTTSNPTTSARSNKSRSARPLLKELPTFIGIEILPEKIRFDLSDGRSILIPLSWSKPLSVATQAQREHVTISAYNVFWDDIDEIIGIENVLFGNQLVL